MRSLRFSLIMLALVIALAIPFFAFGQQQDCNGTFCPLANVEGSKLETLYQSEGTLADFVSNIFTMAISAGAILAVIRLSWAGYLYMTTDSWGSKGQAKEVIGDVVIGLLLLLSIYLILWQINPDILKLNFLNTLSRVESSAPQQAAPAPTNPAIGGVGGTGNIQQDTNTGKCYTPNMATGESDEIPCP